MAQTLPNIPPASKGRDDDSILATISANVISIGESVTTMAMIAQSDARGDAISSANVAENDLTGIDDIGDAGNPNSQDSSSSGGGGGFLSKLFGGGMAGAGLLVGGFGALLAGGGVLLKAFDDFDGEKFKKNIESIMSIVPSITSPGAALAFAADTGLFLITMTQLGLGMAAFGIGQGVAGIAQKFVDFDAQAIKDNVATLLGINDLFGDSFGKALLKGGTFFVAMGAIAAGIAVFGAGSAVAGVGAGITEGLTSFGTVGWAQSIVDNVTTLIGISSLFKGLGDAFIEGGTFLVAMTAIAAGIAVFGAGSVVAGVGAGITKGIESFSKKGWAQDIVDNVTTLIGISSLFKGLGGAFIEGGKFLVAMTSIAAGIAVFGAGSVVAGVGAGITKGIESFSKKGWAQDIVDNVTTLLSINKLFDGFGDALKESGTFLVAMTSIAAGIALFAFGSAAAGAVVGALDVTDFAFRGEGMTWSQSIVDHVKTLLSISSLKGIGADTVKFGLTMTGISTGLAAFGLGSFLAGAGDAAAGWLSKAKEGEGTWADKIKAKVTTLLSIVGGESKLQKSLDFIKAMTNLSVGLAVFTGTSFATSLVGVGTRILDFLAGDSSPVQEMLNIADSADKLEKGASALESLAVSLEKISGLKFDGKSLKLKEFGTDLMESLPYIENAIMGSRGQDLSFIPFNKGQQFEGLASPTIDYAGAVANFQRLQSLGINVQGMPLTNGATQQLKTASSALSSSAAGVSINYINNDNSKNSAPITTNLIELKTDHAEQSQAAFSKRGFAPLGE